MGMPLSWGCLLSKILRRFPIGQMREILLKEGSMAMNRKLLSMLMGSTLIAVVPAFSAEAPGAPVQMAAADTPTKSAAKDSAKAPEEVIVTGTRVSGLKAVDSSAPIQLVNSQSLTSTGQTDLRLSLANLVPSYTAQAFGGDTANLTLSARLRGLSSNHTLVLVNGKRRHGTSNLAVLGGAYQGGAAADLNFIPIDSIERVEVLQDGAAAQYGTDAIAGVINIIMKSASEGGSLTGSVGSYMQGDGETSSVSGNIGTKPTANSFLNITAESRFHDFSFVGLGDQRLFNPANAAYSATNFNNWKNIPGFPYLNRITGDARYRLYNLSANSGVTINKDMDFYLFGTYGRKDASAYENYRRPNRISSRLAGDNPTPNGFSPRERIIEDDYSISSGFKGKAIGWNYDLSYTYGQDNSQVRTEDSINASLYFDTSTTTTKGFSPTSFLAGYLVASQGTANLDLSREFNVGLAGPMNVAWGVEQRHETYEIQAGDAPSRYKEGSQSYPGFNTTDAGSHSRDSWSVYADVAVKPIDKLSLDAALRLEHFSDFGDTTIGKINGRYDFNDMIALRATFSTGFRAPTLAESYYSATNVSPTSAFVQLPPNAAATRLLGLDTLKPEESTNYSFGFVTHPLEDVTATLDLYEIDMKDRIYGSGSLYGLQGNVPQSAAVTAAIRANGNILDPTVTNTGVNVFSNGIDTRTRGADLVVTKPVDYGSWGNVDYSLTGNYNTTKVTKVKPPPAPLAAASSNFPKGQTLFGPDTQSFLETAAPKYKIGIGAQYTWEKLTITAKETMYGPQSANIDPAGNSVFFKTEISEKFITDLEVSYKILAGVTLAVGANNLFNEYPDKFSDAYQLACNKSGGTCVTQYPTYSAIGINGGYYYARAKVSF